MVVASPLAVVEAHLTTTLFLGGGKGMTLSQEPWSSQVQA